MNEHDAKERIGISIATSIWYVYFRGAESEKPSNVNLLDIGIGLTAHRLVQNRNATCLNHCEDDFGAYIASYCYELQYVVHQERAVLDRAVVVEDAK